MFMGHHVQRIVRMSSKAKFSTAGNIACQAINPTQIPKGGVPKPTDL